MFLLRSERAFHPRCPYPRQLVADKGNEDGRLVRNAEGTLSVSYTHLDVYKRQPYDLVFTTNIVAVLTFLFTGRKKSVFLYTLFYICNK